MMMAAQDQANALPFWFKIFVLLLAGVFAGAVVILIISATSAAPVTGSAPSLAISLADHPNTGILGPGEQRWFKLTPSPDGQDSRIEESLTLFFTPDDGNRVRRVSLQLFEESQLPLFYQGNAGRMANFGAGRPISRDNNPRSGELVWTGWLFEGQRYYIQLVNSNDVALEYWLITDDVVDYPLSEEETLSTVPPAPASVVAGHETPHTAIPLVFSQNQGAVGPGQEIWYSFSMADQDGEHFEEVALTMFATPNGGAQAERLTFEVFTAEEIQKWSPGVTSQVNNVGAGSLVHRDNDPLTSERFWTGWVVDGNLHYVRVRNGADVFVDYWLFAGDIYNPELGLIWNR